MDARAARCSLTSTTLPTSAPVAAAVAAGSRVTPTMIAANHAVDRWPVAISS